MSADIVELALDQFTDGALFEKIAAEVMRDEGYHDIKRLGGSGDFGMDAAQDVFYEQDRPARIVFQFTLEDYVLGKLRQTIKKLREHSIEFTELVVVTSARLSSQRQENVRTTARKEFDVTANCFHRDTIVNRLADYSNGIFHRNFPSIEAQLRELQATKPRLSDTDDAREGALLKVAISFGMSREAANVRKSLLDHMVLATLALDGQNGLSASEIATSIGTSLGCETLPSAQVVASLSRVHEQVSHEDDRYSLKPEYLHHADAATVRVNRLTESLVSDLVEKVCANAVSPVSLNTKSKLERNAKHVIRELFRTNSMQLAQLSHPDVSPSFADADVSRGLVALASRQVPTDLGGLLIAALADTFSNPTEEQAKVLAQWARVYLAAATMNLDPVLRECHTSRLQEKIFILDTDVVLSAVVSELPEQPLYASLVRALVSCGVRVVVPAAVIAECACHAGRSPRTYEYHGSRLLAMSPEVVSAEVRNLFVRAYYHGIHTSKVNKAWAFGRYLANYYDLQDPEGFFGEIVRSTLPDEVEIIDVAELRDEPLNEERLTRVTDTFLELMERRAPSFDTRTPEQKHKLAATDARLMLTTLDINTATLTDKTKRILWAKCYIVTNSNRYAQAAGELQLKNLVSASPLQLLTVVERISGPVVSDEALVRLFENQLIVGAVNDVWPDCERLLRNGISLAGKSLVRLRRDLQATLHDALVAAQSADDAVDATAETDEFVSLADSAQALGYQVHPLAKKMRDLLASQDEKDEVIRQLESKLEEVNQVIEQFGKKKQRHLRRVAARKNLEGK